MARPLRIEFPGAVYHITSRGNERKKIFLNDNDRLLFLKTLQQVQERFDWIIHGYVLMDNHYHLLIEIVDVNLSRGMRQLNGVYTQKFNQKYNRAGHLFQGRFKAILVDKDDYLIGISRYIVLNPVRAGLTKKAEDWPWSSYRAMIGLEKPPEWLSENWILSQYGSNKKMAIAEFRYYVEKGIGGEYPKEALQAGLILGNAKFVKKIQDLIIKKMKFKEIPKPQRQISQLSLDEIFLKGVRKGLNRDELIYRSYVHFGYTMKMIADYLGIHYTSVSRAIRKLEKQENKEEM